MLHVTQRWKEYTEDLYDRNNRLTDEEIKECIGPASKEDDPGPSLLKRQKLFRHPLFQEALSASLVSRIDAFLRKAVRFGYASQIQQLADLLSDADEQLFTKLGASNH